MLLFSLTWGTSFIMYLRHVLGHVSDFYVLLHWCLCQYHTVLISISMECRLILYPARLSYYSSNNVFAVLMFSAIVLQIKHHFAKFWRKIPLVYWITLTNLKINSVKMHLFMLSSPLIQDCNKSLPMFESSFTILLKLSIFYI